MLHRLELYGVGDKYTVESGDTWTILAGRFYGNPHMWWAIASANGVTDPTEEPRPGEVIFLPSLHDVTRVIER